MEKKYAYFHLPGLFEFYELYKKFLPLTKSNKEYFYDWVKIGSIYGSPVDTIWSGGRVSSGNANVKDVIDLTNEFDISSRLTFSNSLLEEKHLNDYKCNELCKLFNETKIQSGIIVHSDLLLNYLKNKYNNFYFISSTTKVITDFNELIIELNQNDFKYVVADFRINKTFDKLNSLNDYQKNKIEFLCNECCDIDCKIRYSCYKSVSEKNLGIDNNFKCISKRSNNGYRFSDAKNNKSFISIDDIKNKYLEMNLNNFKIEGRSLGSALVLEMLLYYLVKPEYQINVRESIYLDNMLDLF